MVAGVHQKQNLYEESPGIRQVEIIPITTHSSKLEQNKQKFVNHSNKEHSFSPTIPGARVCHIHDSVHVLRWLIERSLHHSKILRVHYLYFLVYVL